MPLSTIVLPSCVVRLVREPSGIHSCFKVSKITPTLIVLEPWVHQGLVYWIPFPHLHLQKYHCIKIHRHSIQTCKRLLMISIAWLEISFHGCGGYMKDAFWICSWISSSSLKGKVPEISKHFHYFSQLIPKRYQKVIHRWWLQYSTCPVTCCSLCCGELLVLDMLVYQQRIFWILSLQLCEQIQNHTVSPRNTRVKHWLMMHIKGI